MAEPRFLLHHAARSRSLRILWLLEEAGAQYAIQHHEIERSTQKAPGFLALNPFGKLPVLEDRGPAGDWRGVALTESTAICAYVADAQPAAGLAPAIGTPQRAAYQNWLAMTGAVLEPGFADLVFPRAEPPMARMLGWPDFATAGARIEAALAAGGPWLVGTQFTAADLMVGGMLQWVVGWGKYAPGPAITDYLAALGARPGYLRASAADQG